MPSMANITVKKADGTTDVVFSALTPSAGDTVPAQWAPTTEAVPDFRPKVTLVTTNNGSRTARRFRLLFTYPVKAEVNGVNQVVAKVPVEITGTLPTNVSSTEVQEAIYQSGNFFTSSLVRESLVAGYSPT